MKMMKRILTALFAALSVLSCGTFQNTERNMPTTNRSGGYELGSSKKISGTVFQTITNHQALVDVKSIDYKPYDLSERPLVYIVSPSDCKEYFFDKLAINGNYIFIGTHKYKTVNRDFDQFKTVPVFIEKKYYVKGMEWNDWYETINTPDASEI